MRLLSASVRIRDLCNTSHTGTIGFKYGEPRVASRTAVYPVNVPSTRLMSSAQAEGLPYLIGTNPHHRETRASIEG